MSLKEGDALDKVRALADLGQSVLDLVKESGLAKPKRRKPRKAKRKAAPAKKAKAKAPAPAKKKAKPAPAPVADEL